MTIQEGISFADQYRQQAEAWARSDGNARKLEAMKDAVLFKKMKALGDKPIAAAERDVKASQEWHDFITEMVQARTSANEALGEMTYLQMKFEERKDERKAARGSSAFDHF